MVVLARQQLFTENTITVVLPVMANPSRKNVVGLGRMWSIVLLANMVGAVFAAGFCTYTPVLGPEIRDSMLSISRVSSARSAGEVGSVMRVRSGG